MARAARAALADARALEEQKLRQQMHGGAFYGAGMRVGGGATPSMGLSQFRGGKHCNMCNQSDCDCESSSDEEMEGGFGPMRPGREPIFIGNKPIYNPVVDALQKLERALLMARGPEATAKAQAELDTFKKRAAAEQQAEKLRQEQAGRPGLLPISQKPNPSQWHIPLPPPRRPVGPGALVKLKGGAGKGFGDIATEALDLLNRADNQAAFFARMGRYATRAEQIAAARRFAELTVANQRAVEAAAEALRSGRTAIVDAPSTALTLRGGPSTAISTIPGNRGLPFDFSLDVRGMSPAAKASLSSRLAKMGVTPQRLAAALAAGVAVGSLADYFEGQGAQGAAPGAGNYDVYGPGGPVVPSGPGGPPVPPYTPPPGPDAGPGVRPVPEDLVPNTPKRVVAAYLRSGNAPARYRRGNEAQKLALAMAEGAVTGGGKKSGKKPMKENDGRRVRAQAVKAIMAKHGLSLPAASKYLKEHGSA